jgi:16S rRNA (cytidine1402-2'-O)-methyltransferase
MLTLVPNHLGHLQDLSPRAQEALRNCEVLIVEDFKVGSTLLKSLGIERKELRQLSEHSRPDDVADLLELCKTANVAMVSDAGTVNFCDPGFQLVKACRGAQVPIQSLPGPSSLMQIISLSSQQIQEFLFRGFLPAKSTERAQALASLKSERRPVVLMDTPYRLHRLLQDVAGVWPQRRALLGLNLTQADELVIEGPLASLVKDQRLPEKAEFMLLVY